MPITQDRLITLIDITQNALDRHKTLAAFTMQQIESTKNLDPQNPNSFERLRESYLQLAAAIFNSTNLPYEDMVLFIREKTHFELNAQRNKAGAEACRRFRARRKLRREELENQFELKGFFSTDANSD